VAIHGFCYYTTAMKWGTAAPQRGHAFISYVREDGRRVDRLQKFLEENGVPVWRDTARLWPGEDWKKKIQEAIAADSLAFVACFSNNSEARQKSYQRDELLLAIDQLRLRSPARPYFLPVRFDDCPIPDWDIGAGRTLRSLQWVDLFGKQWQTNAERLVEGVQHILRPPPGDGRRHYRTAKQKSIAVAPLDTGSQGDRPGSTARRLSRFQLLVAAVACVTVVIVATTAGVHLFGGRAPLPGTTPLARGIRVTDDTGTISVIVPKSWDNIWYGWAPKEHIPGITYGKVIGQGLNASTNVEKWFSDLTTPGIFVGVSKLLVADHFTPATALLAFGTQCDFLSQQTATSGGLAGFLDMWTCPHSTTRFETVALWPENHSFIAFIELKIVTPADEVSGRRALGSLSVRY
jgi:TIR domain